MTSRPVALAIACIAGLLAPDIAVGSPPANDMPSGVLPVQIVGNTGTRDATAVLVHRRAGGDGVTLYFLTAGHLFSPEGLGERQAATLRVRLLVDRATTIETTGRNVVFPGATEQGVDLAVIKATVSNSTLVPVAITMEPPSAGDVFIMRGYRTSEPATLTERVRFRSTSLVVGDRTAADVGGLVGGAAMTPAGVFGIVSQCSETRVPAIALLSAARSFLHRTLPGWTPAASPLPAFTLERRIIDGPVLQVACGSLVTGEASVPFVLAPAESVLDATAALTSPSSLHLGEVSVWSLDDRVAKVRFTIQGIPPDPFKIYPTDCPHWQALVTVRLDVVVLPRQ